MNSNQSDLCLAVFVLLEAMHQHQRNLTASITSSLFGFLFWGFVLGGGEVIPARNSFDVDLHRGRCEPSIKPAARAYTYSLERPVRCSGDLLAARIASE